MAVEISWRRLWPTSFYAARRCMMGRLVQAAAVNAERGYGDAARWCDRSELMEVTGC
jgi:hypothetical protein